MHTRLQANTQGDYSTAIGEQATAAAPASVAIGYEAGVLDQSSEESVAIGAYALAQAFHAVALGAYASAMVEGGTNISGIIFVRSGSRGTTVDYDEAFHFAGAEAVVMSGLIDLRTAADLVLSLPAGCRFFLSECGLIVTALDALVAQPTVRFGVNGELDKHLPDFECESLSAVGKRARFLPVNLDDGETSLSVGVTVGADANGMMGRAYWKGVLVENEV